MMTWWGWLLLAAAMLMISSVAGMFALGAGSAAGANADTMSRSQWRRYILYFWGGLLLVAACWMGILYALYQALHQIWHMLIGHTLR